MMARFPTTIFDPSEEEGEICVSEEKITVIRSGSGSSDIRS